MAPRHRDNDTSMETILNYDNRDAQSQWSTVWSTNLIPGMDNASGADRYRNTGRRRLRVTSLALSALLTMHTRVPASALTGGFVVFMMALLAAVIILANPLRHFEVYLGQWSISGPGRAFRMVPLFDGIGIAMCLNAIFRAINYCTVAAIAAIYAMNSIHDGKLPFTYCRDFDLKPYDPEYKELRYLSLHGIRILMETEAYATNSSTLDLLHKVWNNASEPKLRWLTPSRIGPPSKIEVCKETYPGRYPALYATPAFNFFYVEVVKLRPDLSMLQFNIPLIVLILGVWTIIWCATLSERIFHNRLIWNNLPQWVIIIPWIWTTLLVFIGAYNNNGYNTLQRAFRFGKKEIMVGLSDALEVSLYIHAASIGTELITGKGLNRYAAGHIDPLFNQENIWHSFFVVLLTGLHSGGAALCAAVDTKHPTWSGIDEMSKSSLWMFPVYSKCASLGGYSHVIVTPLCLMESNKWSPRVMVTILIASAISMVTYTMAAWRDAFPRPLSPLSRKREIIAAVSTSVFLGLTFSYLAVAYVFIKTALHIIFEYQVKLVFREQLVVAALLLSCALLNMLFATHGGLALMEGVESIMTGVTMPLICFLEMVAMLYVYRSRDFTSDMNVAMEESACSSRISIQWQIAPLIALATLIAKCVMIFDTEIPKKSMILATVPLACILLALPLRALHNVYTYLHPESAAI